MYPSQKKTLLNIPYRVNKNRQPRTQSGSALVIAIFIIVVMSVLGAALVNMLDSSQEGVAFEVLGTRAFTAAQSGAQWQLTQLFPLQNVAQTCQSQIIIDNATPNFSNTSGLAQCSVRVFCSSFVHDSIEYYKVTSTGQCDIDGEVTSRTIEIEARSL
jgi:MSHA biogenesis protein MshP